MEKEGTCRATPPHVSWKGTNLLSSLILHSPSVTVQMWRLVNILSVSMLIVNRVEKTVERGVRSWFCGALAGWGIWLVALLDALCHVLSGDAKAQAVLGRTSSPPPYTLWAIRANIKGWRLCQKVKKKGRKKRHEQGAKLGKGSFFLGLVAFLRLCLHSAAPILSPALASPLLALSIHYLFTGKWVGGHYPLFRISHMWQMYTQKVKRINIYRKTQNLYSQRHSVISNIYADIAPAVSCGVAEWNAWPLCWHINTQLTGVSLCDCRQ